MSGSTYNLTALSEKLIAEKRMLPLAYKIRRAQDLASLHTDLVIATESINALEALVSGSQSDDMNRQATEFALLNNAIIHYARATKTKSDERRDFDLQSKFTSEQLIAHQELVDLRDKAIAHFGSGGSYQGLWHAEVVILQAVSGSMRPGVFTRRQTRDKKLLARARTQIETAQAIMRDASEQMLGEMTAELKKLKPEEFEVEVISHPLNLPMLAASEDAAETIRSAANQGGYSKGVVRHGG